MKSQIAFAICSMSILFAANAQQEPVRAYPMRPPPLAPTPKPTPKVFVALPNYNEETATRLQIFLDNNNFGPGKIDGKMGEFFRKALISFKHAHAQRETGVVDQSMLDQVPQTFTIRPGSTALPAPIGTWKIQGAATWPWFRYDEGMLNYGVTTENYYNLPPGPNNLVGVLWMSLNKTCIGIHGTNNPETIGRAASHGCIRLANWDAVRVKDLVSVGNTVIIF